MKESELKKALARYLPTKTGDKSLTPDDGLTPKAEIGQPPTDENLTAEASDLLSFFELLIQIDKERPPCK